MHHKQPPNDQISKVTFGFPHLLIFRLTDRRVAVAAQNRVHRPTYVEVILLGVVGVREIHDMPVAGGCGVRQAGSRRW